MSYNFEIGGLGFNKYVRDDHPYERATAPFRKEQFDSSGRTGDQSLTGWWTRGQFSFHQGEGIKYYEITDGEEVSSRFQVSEGVDTFSHLGETSNYPALGEWFSWPPDRSDSDEIANLAKSDSAHWAVYVDPFGVNDGWLYKITTASGVGTPTFVDPATYGGHTTNSTIDVCSNGDTVWVSDLAGVCLIDGSSDLPSGPDRAIYTTSGQVFHAKNRLWIYDSFDRQLYAEDPYPSVSDPVGAASNLVFTVTETGKGGDTPCLVESEGAVFFSVLSKVYAISVTTDSSGVPTLSPPVVVADTGDPICGLIYHFGYLIIQGANGLRVAKVESPEGGLTLGPLNDTIKGGFKQRGGYKDGSSVYLSGRIDTDSVPQYEFYVFRIDLSQPVGGPLEFAYHRVRRLPTNYGGHVAGVVAASSATGWAVWAGNDGNAYIPVVDTSTPEASGYLTTGYHRFGTLDLKLFHDVTVRMDSRYTSGSISAYTVDADGTEVAIGTVSVPDDEGTFLIPGSARERLALKFVTTPTAIGEAPKLLGYQLRALPVPKRQRLIRVPLMLFDNEKDKRGRPTGSGKRGSAWDRLAALEEMETSNSLVDFTDHDTGETGTAYIESVEVMGKAASDFGGVLTVTLRKVA